MRALLLGLIVVIGLAAGEAGAQALKPAAAPPTLEQAMRDYRRRLEEYERARAAFEVKAGPYWKQIEEKRQARIARRRNGQEIAPADYVLTQPPLYDGPPRPVDPSARPDERPPDVRYIPVVADFLRNATEHFGFVPQRPDSEIAYKHAYARIAAAAGIGKDQAVRIYSFESGGNGKYDVQAGLEYERPNARAVSTALGYNQLLAANTTSLLAEKGDHFVKVLRQRAEALRDERKGALERKIEILRRMVAFSRSVPVQWSEHVKLAATPKGLALHALNLDIDTGPLLQTQKLLDSMVHARAKGIRRPLTAAELEMMNLTGDGNGFDMISMPLAMRAQVPTSNFFQRGGYERNPVAIRNNVVEKLLAATDAKMDKEIQLQGAKDLAAAFEGR